MANDATKVRVGATGKVYGGGTTLPTTAVATPTGFTDMGYVSDAGVTQSINKSTSNLKAWGGDVVRTVTSEHEVTYQLTFIETTAAVLEAYYGDPAATAAAVKIANFSGLRQKWIIDTIDGLYTIRLAIPDGEVTDVGDITYNTEDAIGYQVTITCYPDGTGVKAYKYIDDGVA